MNAKAKVVRKRLTDDQKQKIHNLKSLGLKQAEIAEQVGVSVPSVAKVLSNGSPSGSSKKSGGNAYAAALALITEAGGIKKAAEMVDAAVPATLKNFLDAAGSTRKAHSILEELGSIKK